MHKVADISGVSRSSVSRIAQEGGVNKRSLEAGFKKRTSNKAYRETKAFNY